MSGQTGVWVRGAVGTRAEVSGNHEAADRTPTELGLVFPISSGAVWRKDNFMARVFRPAVRRAELAPLRFHDLRHNYAALMVAARAHPKLLQAQLGHTSINVTLNTYGHLFPDAFADVGDARGSHRQLKHATKPGRVTVAGKGSDDLHPKTAASILRQAGFKQ